MDDLKTQFQTSFIPRIKTMIEKEEEHLKMLKKARQTDFVLTAISKSEQMLSHYRIRLYEYEVYANKL